MSDLEVWNKGKVVGRKPPLSAEQTKLVKMLLTQAGNIRDLALFSVAIDSSLRGIDLVNLRVSSLYDGREVFERVSLDQSKTGERVSFSMSPYTRQTVKELIESENKGFGDYLFTGQRKGVGKPFTTAHYRRLVKKWLSMANLNPDLYGSHSLRRSKVALIYKKTGNLRAVQILLGHKSIESTKHYLGIEEGEALDLASSFYDEI